MKRKNVKALMKMSISDLELEMVECHSYEADIITVLADKKGYCILCGDEYCELENGMCEACTMEMENV